MAAAHLPDRLTGLSLVPGTIPLSSIVIRKRRTDMKNPRVAIITSCTIANMVSLTPVVHATFGAFLIPLTSEFGWARAKISVVLAIIAVAGALIIPLAGHYADRHGAKRMLIAGNIALAAGVASLAFLTDSLTQFYISFTWIAIAGAIPCTAVIAKLVSDWFHTSRGAALGFTSGVGNAVGATLFPAVAAAMIFHYGWRDAYLAIAALTAGIGLPTMIFLLRDAPRHDKTAETLSADGAGNARDAGEADDTDGATLSEALRTSTFWLVLASVAVGGGCLTAIFSHVVPILAERGVGLAMATTVVGVFALVTALWQVGSGTLLDKVSSPRVVVPMYLASVAGLAVFEYGSGVAAWLIGGALLGVGLGTQYGTMPMLVSRYFGLRHFGVIIGVMYSAIIIAQGVTPVLLDYAFDVQGSYRFALTVIGASLTIGGLLLLLLPSWKASSAAPDPAHAIHH